MSYQNLQQIEEIRQQFLSYLVDSSLIQVDRAYQRGLSRWALCGKFCLRILTTIYSAQNRGKPQFIMVPHEYDVHPFPGRTSLINTALVAGLYPRILTIDSNTSLMRTISNNQTVHFHPSSTNFGRKPLDVSGGANCLVYFTLM